MLQLIEQSLQNQEFETDLFLELVDDILLLGLELVL